MVRIGEWQVVLKESGQVLIGDRLEAKAGDTVAEITFDDVRYECYRSVSGRMSAGFA